MVDPEFILWKNYGFSYKERQMKNFISFLIFISLIAITIFVQI